MHYKVIHNGTEGILAVNAYFQLINLTLTPNMLWAISIKLTHEWVNQTHYYELSGYPGYVFGKPIITGVKTPKERKQNHIEDGIKMSYHRNRWLTFFGTSTDGDCLKMRRHNVLFGENVYTHCFTKVPYMKTIEHCEKFQQEVRSWRTEHNGVTKNQRCQANFFFSFS